MGTTNDKLLSNIFSNAQFLELAKDYKNFCWHAGYKQLMLLPNAVNYNLLVNKTHRYVNVLAVAYCNVVNLKLLKVCFSNFCSSSKTILASCSIKTTIYNKAECYASVEINVQILNNTLFRRQSHQPDILLVL